jgi:hypothetical protein
LKRQIIARLFGAKLAPDVAKAVTETWEAPSPTVTPKRRMEVQSTFQKFEQAQSDFSLNDEEGRKKFISQRRAIEKIELVNFKSIRTLQLDLASSASGRSGWLMLLGENGTGKSTILQALALTLAGADYFATLVHKRKLSAGDFIRTGTRKATVRVKISGFTRPHELVLSPHRAVFSNPGGEASVQLRRHARPVVKAAKSHLAGTQSVVLGYGATRLLPRENALRYGIPYARVDNLFDPFLPLFDAESWVMKLKRKAFDQVALVLKDLLALDERATLVRERGRLMVREHGSRNTLRRLSDGYQAVIAMSIDILEVVGRLWPRLEDAEGIVLLDEIGSHLHPVWKMRIVASLRRAFPGMQFIATTHEPLCLRGLGEGEVVVMKRDPAGAVEAIGELPSPSDFRIEQLLTSEFFGLNTTSDPETEREFDKYYALMAMRSRTPEEESELERLAAELERRKYLGNTLREQLMYAAIDKLVARQKHGARKPVEALKQEAIEEVARIWSEA